MSIYIETISYLKFLVKKKLMRYRKGKMYLTHSQKRKQAI